MSEQKQAAVDPASGTRAGDGDRFGAAISEQRGELSVLLAARQWTPPFSPMVVVEECARWVQSYGLREVSGDRWSGELIRELFRQQGIEYRVNELDKSGIYAAFVPLLNAGRIRLLDDAELLRQLRNLERRRGWAGKDRIDHRRGTHDDLANAVCASLVLCAHGAAGEPARLWGGSDPVAATQTPEEAEREQAEARAVGVQWIAERVATLGAWFPSDG